MCLTGGLNEAFVCYEVYLGLICKNLRVQLKNLLTTSLLLKEDAATANHTKFVVVMGKLWRLKIRMFTGEPYLM